MPPDRSCSFAPRTELAYDAPDAAWGESAQQPAAKPWSQQNALSFTISKGTDALQR